MLEETGVGIENHVVVLNRHDALVSELDVRDRERDDDQIEGSADGLQRKEQVDREIAVHVRDSSFLH